MRYLIIMLSLVFASGVANAYCISLRIRSGSRDLIEELEE